MQGFIVGSHQLLNELLADHLRGRLEMPWDLHARLHMLPPAPVEAEAPTRRVVLWDVQTVTARHIGQEILDCTTLDPSRDALALFNLYRDTGIEEASLPWGVRGFFYVDDSPQWLVQGVRGLVGGQVWLNARTMVGSHPAPSRGLPAPWNLLISSRELQALELVVQGRSNQEIAESMSISPYTVKTHLYRLYKKIEVSSRLEAMIWYRMITSR